MSLMNAGECLLLSGHRNEERGQYGWIWLGAGGTKMMTEQRLEAHGQHRYHPEVRGVR